MQKQFDFEPVKRKIVYLNGTCLGPYTPYSLSWPTINVRYCAPA